MSIRLLFVEDDDRLREVLLEAAAVENYQAEGVGSAEEGLERLKKGTYDILVTDVTLPGMSGLDLLPHCQRLCPGIISIVITAYGTIDIAVEAMKRGATDFLTKPFALTTLTGTIRVAAERVIKKRKTAGGARPLTEIQGESPVMKRLLEQVTTIAPFNMTVLVTGETGTGKEIIARTIHRQSPRQASPFIALNCAAVPEQLLEDELFGHVKGAFTGAQVAREGRFEQANGGTLFLDEIGDMSLPLQSKLLRVLQEREFEKLGSSRTIKVDVRVVAATSADLERRIEEGTFRTDLYYRLNVVHLRLPPLRERAEDIHSLAQYLLARFCTSVGLPQKEIDADAWQALVSYRWPGNVRQLQNAMERAAALSSGATMIRLEDLPDEVRGGASSGVSPAAAAGQATPAGSEERIPDEGLNFEAVVTNVERELLLKSLHKTGGNKMRAAKLLNMKRTTFVEKLKRLQISTEEETEDESSDG
jgi:DNA-binding NtrC family response regulator